MIVVADTGSLNYLIQIDCDKLLPQIYQRVFVPAAVIQELEDPSASAPVRLWLAHRPRWLEVRLITSPPDASLASLDRGEREAIQLAEELHADFLLIDERRGDWRQHGEASS
jgi:predicted nucleic acid-binding protein